jgi:hypothetical protein
VAARNQLTLANGQGFLFLAGRFASSRSANYAQGMPCCALIRRSFVVLLAVAAGTLAAPIARAQFDDNNAGTYGGQLGKAETHKWEFGVVITGVGGPSASLPAGLARAAGQDHRRGSLAQRPPSLLPHDRWRQTAHV